MRERSIPQNNKPTTYLNQSYCAYIRVSTTRQGERSVSLPEQREAILRYASRQGLNITQWYEEQQTAAKRGRPIWMTMLKSLRHGKARGVVIHKIDRSARNLKDWADLGDLIDQGIEVHFANESLDMNSRGGRLSADIQAVVASDYIRNLREEAKKGIYGRLKQGFYPLPAPLGYVDNGAAKPKTIHPEKGPLVRKAFELYASGAYSIPRLVDELHRIGLRSHREGKVSQNGLWKMLKNPFYVGVIRIFRTNQMFEGNHEPLISRQMFERVQDIMHGRLGTRTRTFELLFRRTIRCANCKHHLIGEVQKNHVYYRCHQKGCPSTSVREEAVDAVIRDSLNKLQPNAAEKAYLAKRVVEVRANWIAELEGQRAKINMRLQQISDRLNRLTDAYVDQSIEKDIFEERKAALFFERQEIKEKLARIDRGESSMPDELNGYVELINTAFSAYLEASDEGKRRLLKSVTSNLSVNAKSIDFALLEPFQAMASRPISADGGPSKEIGLVWDLLAEYFSKHSLTYLS